MGGSSDANRFGSFGAPNVAVDKNGNTVVTWTENLGDRGEVMARRISAGGVLGPQMTLQTHTSINKPSIAVDRSSGEFVVAFTSNGSSDSSGNQVDVVEVSANGAVHRVSVTGAKLSAGAVSVLGKHRYLLTYTSDNSRTKSDILGRIGRFT